MNLHTQAAARKIIVFPLNHSNLKMLSSVSGYGVSSFTCSACVISCSLFTNSSFAEAFSGQSIVGHGSWVIVNIEVHDAKVHSLTIHLLTCCEWVNLPGFETPDRTSTVPFWKVLVFCLLLI